MKFAVLLQKSLQDFTKETALQLAFHCSSAVLSQVHAHFQMTVHGGNYKQFAEYCKGFHAVYYDSNEALFQEYPTLQTRMQWDTAALQMLKKFKENQGTN